MRFTCSTCGLEHDASELSFGAPAPLQWCLLTQEERAQSVLSDDQCEIVSAEGPSWYIRACLEIPIQNSSRSFTWGVWCSLSEKSYVEMSDHWDDPERTTLGPYFGWFCVQIPHYPDTAFLRSMVHMREVGLKPLVVLEQSDHPLAIDQMKGIEENRLKRIVMELLHPCA